MYVDAILDRPTDRILVVERDKAGNRIFREFPAEYVLYYDDPKGKYQTIYRTQVSKFSTRSNKEFQKEKKIHGSKRLWESDCNAIFRSLETHYIGQDSPTLHTCFFDIETSFDLEKGGYAPVENPFNHITAISLYLDWMDRLITLALSPPSLSKEQALSIASKFSDTYLFDTEADMLDTFLNLVDDADVLSGWNSEGYDIPYTVGRIIRSLSKDDLRRLCLWNQMPKKRDYERYGNKSFTYDLFGRVHLDYMQLYRKYTYEERHSYSLDAIGEYELHERKVAYEGTLDQLYNQDFHKFIDYNRQDTNLLAKLDKKLKFLDLANNLAHDNTVLLQTTMGAVAVTDQAIINEAHRLGFIVPSRSPKAIDIIEYDENGGLIEDEVDFSDRAAGAYVAYPKVGIHQFIGAIDINSLYPSVIRALNMGPETIVGQLRPIMTEKYITDKMADKWVNNKLRKGCSFAGAWEGLFGSLEYTAVMDMDPDTEITIDWEGGANSSVHTAKEVWQLIFEGKHGWVLSANGTIFHNDFHGIIPGLLARWYAERKDLQAKKKAATEKDEIAFWDKRQLVKKINLNSLYGALLNPGSRFHDHRIGQSTTLTGRIIAKHMDAVINEYVTGKYDYDGEAIVYGDTDSCYFSVWPIIKDEVKSDKLPWNKDICIQMYDEIAEHVNKSFPAMMEKSCHCAADYGSLIRGGRELVAETGLFITKKRYAVLVYDLEGIRLDKLDEELAKKKGAIPGIGKVKAMGLDLKRSDTPVVVQRFLSDILLDVLTFKTKDDIVNKIRQFKQTFTELPAWEKGTPKRVNNLTTYIAAEERKGKSGMPGHVRASMNWNNLRRMHGDNHSMKIVDGMKIIVCKLKPNPLGYTSVSYPIDTQHIPQWFKDLPFDNDLMEATIVDKKIDNLLGALGWDLTNNTQINSTFDSLFTIGD
jgi:DNA polymerase elongation subunit (family B)